MNRIKSVIRHMIQAYARAARGTKPRTGARAIADIARSYAAEMVEHGVIRDSYRPCSVCGAADHDGVVHGTVDGIRPHRPMTAEEAALQERAYREIQISPDVIAELRMIQSPVRPSDEIVKCGVCGHQHHPSNVFRCPGSVPSGEPSGGIEACRCDGTRILDEDDFDDARQDDQYAVDEAQLSPGAYRLQWGELPRITFNAHQFWCGRRDHDFMQCPFWGEE